MSISHLKYTLALLCVASLQAAPRLSLLEAGSNPSTVSLSVSVAAGANGPNQIVHARNIGDGQLNLQASSSVPWLAPSIGQTENCSIIGPCLPVQVALNTASLAKGTYTGTVTVSDPNAIDSPKFIQVTVAVGGNVPDKLDFYVKPGGSASASFTTVSPVTATASASPWLTVLGGSFRVLVSVTAADGMAVGDYSGSITLSGSSFAPDNKAVPVVMHITTQPILQVVPTALQFRAVQGSAKQSATLAVGNAGQGTLDSSSVTTTVAGGSWLTAQSASNSITVTADPTGLTPNLYQGTVTIKSSAANSQVIVPVDFSVVTQTPPLTLGLIANGTLAVGQSLAQGAIVSLFGDQLTAGDPQNAATLPLPTILGDIRVLVNNQPAPLYFVSPGQINFEVPIDATTGDGTVQVVRNGQNGNRAFINIKERVPHYLLLNGGPYAIMTTPANELTGIPSHPLKSGDVIVLYVTGLGPTSPLVPSGTAAPAVEPFARVTGTSQVCFGKLSPFDPPPPCAAPFFVGLAPNFVGLYQINLTVPDGVPAGTVSMSFLVNGISSDVVQLAVQ